MPAYTMAGRAPGAASASARRRALSAGEREGMTEKARLGRSNPVVTFTGSRRPRRATMSAATRGVAVAVEATSARAPT